MKVFLIKATVLLHTSPYAVCARRVVADIFLRATGKRLFQEYYVVRFISKGVFSWLFAEGDRPSFFF